MTRTIIPDGIDQWVPFTIHPDGTVTQQRDIHAPEDIMMDTDADGSVPGEPDDPEGWTLLRNRSGQYSYHGAIMHPSEYLGGAVLRDLFAEAAEDGPVTIVCLAVSAADDDEAFGWVIAQMDAQQPAESHSAQMDAS